MACYAEAMALPRVTHQGHAPQLRRAREVEAAARDTSAIALQRAPTPLQFLVGSFTCFARHADGVHAGALAFFGLLSLFPLLLLTITLFQGVIRSDAAAQLVLAQLGALMPDSGPVANTTAATLDIQPAAVGFSLFALLWASLGVFVTLGYSLDRAFGDKGDRNIVVRYLVAAALSLAVGATAMAAALLAKAAESQGSGLGVGYFLLEYVIVWAAIVLLYRAVPRAHVGWPETLVPAALVTVACAVARLGFNWYVGNIAHLDRIYGPMASVVGLVLWLFVTSAVLLWGAELAHQLAVGTPDLPLEAERVS